MYPAPGKPEIPEWRRESSGGKPEEGYCGSPKGGRHPGGEKADKRFPGGIPGEAGGPVPGRYPEPHGN